AAGELDRDQAVLLAQLGDAQAQRLAVEALRRLDVVDGEAVGGFGVGEHRRSLRLAFAAATRPAPGYSAADARRSSHGPSAASPRRPSGSDRAASSGRRAAGRRSPSSPRAARRAAPSAAARRRPGSSPPSPGPPRA